MSALPREARDGLMRAWLKVLHDRHPQVTWVPASLNTVTDDGVRLAQTAQLEELAQST